MPMPRKGLMQSLPGHKRHNTTPKVSAIHTTVYSCYTIICLIIIIIIIIDNTHQKNRCNKRQINRYREGLREGKERQKKRKKREIRL